MTIYRYTALENPGDEIRVAILQPGEFDHDICVSFETCSLNAMQLGYEALSYVWGSEENPLQASVSSLSPPTHGIVSITRNLDVALRHLRHKSDPRRLWIDALCIDQRQVEERSVQVSIMDRVYSTADRVVAWLGQENSNSDDAIALLQMIAKTVEVDQYTFVTRAIAEDPNQWADRNVAIPWKSSQYSMVCALLSRSYFERAWIQQEVHLAKTIKFHCGHVEFSERDIWWSAVCLHLKPTDLRDLTPTPISRWKSALGRIFTLGTSRAIRWRSDKEKVPLIGLRYLSRELKCRDSHDRIYGFLGLLTDRDQSLQIMPDYSREVADVFTEIARRKATAHHTLELLWSCELSSKPVDMPSWVPDWSAPIRSELRPLFLWSACGFISAEASFTSSKCTAAGVRVASVSVVNNHSLDTYLENDNKLLRFLRSIKPKIEIRTGRYKSGEHMKEAFCRTLVGGRFSDLFDPPNMVFPDFKQGLLCLKRIWKKKPTAKDAADHEALSSKNYLSMVSGALQSACFIQTNCGYIGTAPAGTQIGDIIAVILGCNKPVVLRRNDEPRFEADTATWSVIGACYVHGIMNGEVIYRDSDPLRYKAVAQDPAKPILHVDEYAGMLHDTKIDTYITDPTTPLAEAEINVESYVRDPHRLVVLPETLRAAGVAVEEITLV